MCLVYSSDATRAFRKKHAAHSYVTAYKVLILDYDKLISQCYFNEWKVGVNKSTRETKGRLTNWCEVYKGIHVYLCTRKQLSVRNGALFNNERVLPVKCYIKDLVGVSIYGEAVFMKVTVSQRSYNRAKKGA